MADLDVVAYLASKGYHGRQANGPEVAYPCFFDCNEESTSRKRKLYVNTEDGFYTCFVCGASGGTYLLQKHFGDDPAKPSPGADPYVRRRILNWAAEVGSTWLANNDEQLLWLMKDRGLSPETILERKLGIVLPPWSLTGSLPEEFTRSELNGTGLVWSDGPREGKDYFYNHLLVPYMSRGNVVGMRGRLVSGTGAKYLTGQGDAVRLFNIDSLDGADDVIITEAELDAVVVYQHLQGAADDRARRIAVIGLSGINGFPDGAESYLANAKRIYIGFDPDDAGKRGAVKLKEQLGARARILELPEDLPKADWSEFLLPIPADATPEWRGQHPHAGHTWRDVMELLGTAAGKRVHTIQETGVAYRRRQEENPEGGLKIGYSKFDHAIQPGLVPGQVMVVLAKTGTGKTLFLCNVAWFCRKEPILFVSLEMTREEVYDRLVRVARFWNPRWSTDQVEDELSNILICDENRLTQEDFLELLDEFELEKGCRPKLALVDYLGYLARGMHGNSPYEKVSNAIMMLKAVAKDRKHKLAMIVPAQVNRGSEQGKRVDLDGARESGVVEETADFVISLYRPDLAKNQPQRRAPSNFSIADDEPVPLAEQTGLVQMEILKSRNGGLGDSFALQFDPLSLTLVGQTDAGYARAKQNFSRRIQGWSYHDLRAEETKPIQSSLPYRS